jgi:hypothetical protein
MGSRNKKIFSGMLLAIIAYLIYAKNKKSATESIRLTDKRSDKKVRNRLCRREERAQSTASS